MVITAQNTKLMPGYKQTKVGIIPEDWGVSEVGEEFEIQLGKMLDAEKNTGLSKPYLGNKAVQWDRIDISNLQMMAMSRSDLERFRLRHGDLLVCEGGEVGRAAIWDAPIEECYYQKALHRLRPLRGFNPCLMLAFLRYWTDHGKLADYVSQTSIAHLTREKFIKVPMAIPTSDEQQAIATVLSDMDALITSLNKLIAKKRDIKQAAMQQLLTGKMRLPGFGGEPMPAYKQIEVGMIPEDWDVYSVEEIADVTTGDKDTQDKTESGAYPFFVRSQTVERINSYSYDGEAVLTAGDGVGVGKVFHYANGKFDFHQRVYMISNFRRCDGFFFYLYFSNNFYKEATKYNAKNSVDSVRREMVTGMSIPCPPLPEQQAIATILSDMDAEIAALEQRRDKTRALKQGMMQELLTGKTRLVTP